MIYQLVIFDYQLLFFLLNFSTLKTKSNLKYEKKNYFDIQELDLLVIQIVISHRYSNTLKKHLNHRAKKKQNVYFLR
jgi:hypothetical protein